MYARVTPGEVAPDRIDEAITVYRRELLPGLQQVQGFKGVLPEER